MTYEQAVERAVKVVGSVKDIKLKAVAFELVLKDLLQNVVSEAKGKARVQSVWAKTLNRRGPIGPYHKSGKPRKKRGGIHVA